MAIQNNSTESLWNEIIQDASGMEAFDPGISGFTDNLESLKNGQELSNSWISQKLSKLTGDQVVEIAFKLNQIAGILFSEKDKDNCIRICSASLVLYEAALGSDHPDTKVIAENLKKLQEPETQKPRLPKLKNFRK